MNTKKSDNKQVTFLRKIIFLAVVEAMYILAHKEREAKKQSSK